MSAERPAPSGEPRDESGAESRGESGRGSGGGSGARGLGRRDSAALAANWRVIVAVDVAMGVAVTVAGVLMAALWSGWGWFLAAAGSLEVFFAGGRASRWRRLRRRAGL